VSHLTRRKRREVAGYNYRQRRCCIRAEVWGELGGGSAPRWAPAAARKRRRAQLRNVSSMLSCSAGKSRAQGVFPDPGSTYTNTSPRTHSAVREARTGPHINRKQHRRLGFAGGRSAHLDPASRNSTNASPCGGIRKSHRVTNDADGKREAKAWGRAAAGPAPAAVEQHAGNFGQRQEAVLTAIGSPRHGGPEADEVRVNSVACSTAAAPPAPAPPRQRTFEQGSAERLAVGRSRRECGARDGGRARRAG